MNEYEFVLQPRLAGYGPTLLAGLCKDVDARLANQLEFALRRWRYERRS